jgi:hypothetical protein
MEVGIEHDKEGEPVKKVFRQGKEVLELLEDPKD